MHSTRPPSARWPLTRCIFYLVAAVQCTWTGRFGATFLPGASALDLGAAVDSLVAYCSSQQPLQSPLSPANVQCSGSDVISISLQNAGLVGPIPDSLSRLTHLHSLSLGFNQLTGSLPTFLSLLDLRTLTLNDNSFSGQPPLLSKYQNFSLLDLSNNLLCGAVIDPNDPLCSANLDNNCFSYSACTGSSNTFSQRFLTAPCNASAPPGDVCLNPLSSVVSTSLQFCNQSLVTSGRVNFPGLACLNYSPFLLDTTQFSTSATTFNNRGLPIPDAISTLAKLGGLALDRANLGGQLPPALASLTGLVVLSLATNSLTGPVPDWISSLEAITELDLNNNNFQGTLSASLAKLTTVGNLQLQSNALYGPVPLDLVTLPAINSIVLDNNQLSGSYPDKSQSLLNLVGGKISFKNNFVIDFPQSNQPGLELTTDQCAALNSATFRNCFTNASTVQRLGCLVSTQKSPSLCGAFCQASGKVCSGQGYCYLQPGSSVGTCACFAGYSPDPSTPGTCVPTGSLAPASPPPPPGPAGIYTLGFNQSETPSYKETYLNRWSRYLSRNYYNVLGSSAWQIQQSSKWIAEKNQFYPDLDLPQLFYWSPPSNQGDCRSCWAYAVSDAVGAAAALATNPRGGTIPQISPELIKTCSVDNRDGGCDGGMPANALDLLVTTGARPTDQYSSHVACSSYQDLEDEAPVKVLMYEQVQFSNSFGLILALSSQPVVVVLEGSYIGFQLWTSRADHSNVFQDPNCYSGSLDHTVLVVGYQLASFTPYFVIRNSWGTGWGDNGYMRIAMQSADVTGVCGIYVFPAIYPIVAPAPNDPCYLKSFSLTASGLNNLNPCGGGVCVPRTDLGPYSYTCDCSKLIDFVAVNNTVALTLDDGTGQEVTQTCAPRDACTFSLYNPCGVGTCINTGTGDYTCICPLGYILDVLKDGRHICSYQVTDVQGGLPQGATTGRKFTVPATRVSCYQVYVSYGLSKAQLLQNNPGLDCSTPLLPEGLTLDVSNPNYIGCLTPYTVSKDDTTCQALANNLSIDASQIQTANPGLNCQDLTTAQGLVICLKEGSPEALFPCFSQYKVVVGDTCSTIIQQQAAVIGTDNPALQFYSVNPGINCDNLAASEGIEGAQDFVCLASASPGGTKCKPTPCCPSSSYYTTLSGETCTGLAIKKIGGKKLFPNWSLALPYLQVLCSNNPIPTSTKVCLPPYPARKPPST